MSSYIYTKVFMFKTIRKVFSNMGQWFLKLATPNLDTMKQNMLTEAKVSLLNAQSGLEYAENMVNYHSAVVKRLELDLNEQPQISVSNIRPIVNSIKTSTV